VCVKRLKKAELRAEVGENLTRSSRPKYRECRQIVNARIGDEARIGSAWDDKVHNGTGLTYRDLRYKVGQAVVVGKHTVSGTAEMYGVSVGFVHKWSKIFAAYRTVKERDPHHASTDVFRSLTNRPLRISRQVPEKVRAAIVRLRREYPFAGSAKIGIWLREETEFEVSHTGIDGIMRAEGLMGPRRRRNNGYHGRFERERSLSMVQIDYKTWPSGVKTMWVLDDRSRAILGYKVSAAQSAELTIELLEETFAYWGAYPEQILTDHGSEFYSISGGKGASMLDRWCGERGIEHIMGRVRHPQTQGKIERSHGTATVEIARFGSMDTVEEATGTVGRWVEFYNTVRPHMAVDMGRPLDVFLAGLPPDRLELFLEGAAPRVVSSV
jgi:putative transposase